MTYDNPYIRLTDSTASQHLQITGDSKCAKPLCTNSATLGGDYCLKHKRRPFTPPINTFDWGDDRLKPQPPDPKPSRRELQRQLDRIEGKLDALLNKDD